MTGHGASREELSADFAPWEFWDHATEEQRDDQRARTTQLRSRGHIIGEGCVVSRLAAVHPETLVLGDRSYVAAHAHVSGDVSIGADCSVNVGVAVRGRVRIGRAVRIGAYTSVLGFDHGFADPTTETFRQPLTSAGIEIGDDVWIGSHAVVLDGVRIGAHCVVGAAAVVTKDVPEWTVVVGNPARIVRDRRSSLASPAPVALPRPAGSSPSAPPSAPSLGHRLASFGRTVKNHAPALLAAAWSDGFYRDTRSAPPTVRAHTDAVELADTLLGAHPPQLSPEAHVRRLQGAQSRVTGTVPELDGDRWPTDDDDARGDAADPPASVLTDQTRAYHVLSVGYALDLLGSRFEHPVHAWTSLSPQQVVQVLDDLPWDSKAWGAGALVDSLGTALTWAHRRGQPLPEGLVEAVLGWLARHRDPVTGLWGSVGQGMREPVNGTYRAVRGTLDQWGVSLGGEDLVADAVLAHAPDVVGAPAATACDALDVVYLLHRTARVLPDHRAAEIREVARTVLDEALAAWEPGLGIPFAAGAEPSLQGTEMWLSVAWYAADVLGLADRLDYRPRGVHRPEPALRL